MAGDRGETMGGGGHVTAPSDTDSTIVALLDATLESIHQHGLVQTTVSTVTDIAGLSRGMVRHHFGSKQAMIVRAMATLCERWLTDTQPDPKLSGAAQVRSIITAMFDPAAFTPVGVDAWLALSVGARSDQDLREIRNRTQRVWTEQLTSAFTLAGAVEPGVAAHGLVAAADGLWLGARLDDLAPDQASDADIALRVANALLAQS